MQNKPSSCNRCPIAKTGQGFVLAEGTGSNKVAIIGDMPGKWEAALGKPFQGKPGHQLEEFMKFCNEPRENFSLYHSIQCRPPNDWLDKAPYETGAIQHCNPNLVNHIAKSDPNVILALGEVASRTIMGSPGSLVVGHQPRGGYVFKQEFAGRERYIISSLDPLFIIQKQQKFVVICIDDMKKALDVAKANRAPWEDYNPRYILHPSKDDIKQFIREAKSYCGPDYWMNCDIETPESTNKEEEKYKELKDQDILRISFAFRPGYAITIEWLPENFKYIQELLELPESPYMTFWNYDFDYPRLISKGMRIPGKILDGMWLWHWFQTALPKSLGFVSAHLTDFHEWKSMADAQPEVYSCMDADAAITNIYECRDRLMKERRWDSFIHHWVDLEPVLVHMGNNGVNADEEVRTNLRAKLVKEWDDIRDKLQELVPDSLKNRKVYALPPMEFRCRECKGKGYNKKTKTVKKKKVVSITECTVCDNKGWIEDLVPAERRGTFSKKLGTLTLMDDSVKMGEDRKERPMWGIMYNFLPGSTDQMVKYMKAKGYQVPINYKTKKPTTGVKQIQALMWKNRKDEVLPLSIEYRQHNKLISNYVDGYAPDDDGRIRGRYNQQPWTLRLAMHSPNMQNIIKRADLARLIRRQFIASPGHRLVECDHAGAEAVFTGYYANDPEYIRVAKLSAHGVFGSIIAHNQALMSEPIDVNWPEEDIIAAVSEFKKKFGGLYDVAKRGIHGSHYGMKAYKAHKDFPREFPTQKYAQHIFDLYFDTLGRNIKAWQDETLMTAYKQKYLQNDYNYRFWFWDVLKTNRDGTFERDVRGNLLHGDQANKALSCLPQSTESAYIKEAMLTLYEDEFYRNHMVGQTHDSLMFDLPDNSDLSDHVKVIHNHMTFEAPELNGLNLGLEIKVGQNWDYKDDANPDGMEVIFG